MPARELIERLQASLADGTFVRLTLTRPVRSTDGLERVLGRYVHLNEKPHFSLTFRYPTRDVTKNIPLPEVATWLRAQLPANFRGALLTTTTGDWQLTPKRLVAHPPQTKVAPSRAHDEAKTTLLDESAQNWLRRLKVTPDKDRQIRRYLEIVAPLAKDAGTIVDMGCGKGYLTFALWHVLRTKVVGVEQRPELVTAANDLAREIGATGLEFVTGTIETVNLPAVGVLIALHACNTATDDALRRGVAMGTKLIVVAPCCHQEVRPQLGKPVPLDDVLRHGLMAERMAEWATDGLRVLFLEWAGYRTKVIEFVGSEHTPKNLMIVGIREREPLPTQEKLERFKEFFGIRHHALD